MLRGPCGVKLQDYETIIVSQTKECSRSSSCCKPSCKPKCKKECCCRIFEINVLPASGASGSAFSPLVPSDLLSGKDLDSIESRAITVEAFDPSPLSHNLIRNNLAKDDHTSYTNTWINSLTGKIYKLSVNGFWYLFGDMKSNCNDKEAVKSYLINVFSYSSEKEQSLTKQGSKVQFSKTLIDYYGFSDSIFTAKETGNYSLTVKLQFKSSTESKSLIKVELVDENNKVLDSQLKSVLPLSDGTSRYFDSLFFTSVLSLLEEKKVSVKVTLISDDLNLKLDTGSKFEGYILN
jgi:hypothetical protein